MSDLRGLLSLFRPQLGWLLLGALLSLVTMLANIGLMATSGWFISAMALAGVAGVSMNYFTPAALIRGMAITRTAGRYAERLLTHDATLRVLSDLRVWFYKGIEPLAPAGLQHFRSADLLNRIQADIDTLNGFYISAWIPMVTAICSVILVFMFSTFFSVSFAFVLLALLITAGLLLPVLSFVMARRPLREEQDLTSISRIELLDFVRGLSELRVYAAEQHYSATIRLTLKKLLQAQDRVNRVNVLGQISASTIAQASVWLCLIVVVPEVEAGHVDGPILAMLALLALSSFEAVSGMPEALHAVARSLTAGNRLFELVRSGEPEQIDIKWCQPESIRLEFENISFAYQGSSEQALDDVSFTVEPGQHIAIVGPSGAGKTSILNLILRFAQAQKGNLSLGGVTVDQIDEQDLRNHFAVVSQNGHIFNTTIEANLRLASPNATMDEITQAARKAGIHDEIMQLPHGYKSFVGEAGISLSGGQQRRIELARAFLKDAPFLLLDEPTEGLDQMNTRLILDILKSEFGDKSMLMITHQMHGLEDMDTILVLDHGRIVEQGIHDHLMLANGIYSQFQRLSKGLLV